jgi:hypothetical protein
MTSPEKTSAKRGSGATLKEYKPAPWEKITAFVVAVVVVGVGLVIVVRGEEIPARNFVLLRIMLSFALAVLGAVIPGFLHVGLTWKGVVIRAFGACALFVITYFFTPAVIPTEGGKNGAPEAPKNGAVESQPENIDIAGVSFMEGEEDARAPRLDLQFTNQGVRSAFITKFNVNVKKAWRLAELPRAAAENVIPVEAKYVVKLKPSDAPYTRSLTISHGLKRDEFGRFTVQFREEWPSDSRTIYLAEAEIVANSTEKKHSTGDLLFLMTQQGERFPNAEKIKETIRVMKERRLPLDLKDFRHRLEENRKMILEADKNKGKRNPAMEILIKTAKESDFEKAFDEE